MSAQRNTAVVDLVTQAPRTEMAAAADGALVFERLASDPNVSVDKIERLMALWERSEARKAEALFNTAMSQAQAEMRQVTKDASNQQTNSSYASYAAIDHAIRPIYTTHGFGLSFDTADGAAETCVRVLCYVTHIGGHSRTYHIDMPADGKGAKGGDVMTRTHATGSATSYGMRYLLKMIFNVAVGEYDDDGQRASGPRPVEPKRTGNAPEGFEAWLATLDGAAAGGMREFAPAWNKSADVFRKHITQTAPGRLAEIRAKATAASGGGK